MFNKFTIGVWNTKGLVSRRYEVEIFLESNKMDIRLISESHFTNKNYS